MNLYVILKDEANHIIHHFSMCHSFNVKHIFSMYGESFYGCELINFTKPYKKLYISWRKIIRYMFHCLIVS